jgi:phosphoribosyl-ATP pyrophosphohydrolase
MEGIVPTVVCDVTDGRVRMLAYSTPESLRCALTEGAGVYWSRSRQTLWRKGAGSGNSQRLVRASVDCDRDALIFHVAQNGPTCHTGRDRCFDGPNFAWETLIARIDDRLRTCQGASYTARLARDSALLDAKILEEAEEVTTAPDGGSLAWECADLLYFMSVRLRSKGLGLCDVFAQLAARAT